MATTHSEQVAHFHGLEIIGRLCRGVGGEEPQHGIIQAELALLNCQANSRGVEAFAKRRQHMRFVRRLGLPPSFGDGPAMAQDHEAVQGVDLIRCCEKSRIAFDGTPCVSGVLLDKGKPAACAELWRTRGIAVTEVVNPRKFQIMFTAAKEQPAIKASITDAQQGTGLYVEDEENGKPS